MKNTTLSVPSLIGQIVVDSWGYSMTLVNFYKIISETEKTVTVREISASMRSEGYLTGKTFPLNIEGKGEEKNYRLYKTFDHDGNLDGVKGSLDYSKTHYLDFHVEGKEYDFNHCD